MFSSRCSRSPNSLSLLQNNLSYGNDTIRPKDDNLDRAISKAAYIFLLQDEFKAKLIHLCDIFNLDLPIWDSSVKWEKFDCKTLNDIRHNLDAIRDIRYFWHRVKYEDKYGVKMSMPSVFMHSHFVNDDKTKLKIAWKYPPTVTFGEAVFAVPLIEAYQKYPTPIAYGYETVNDGISKIIREAHGKYFYALDFKSFDETVPTWLIRIAADILILNTNFAKYRNAGVPDARRMYAMFNTIIDYFINTKIQLYSGKLFLKRGGIASGSYFTQLIQSIINCILIF